MRNLTCLFLGHKPKSHLDYIWGSLAREHKECERCEKTLLFERPTEEREEELSHGWIGDGDTRGCKAL